MAVAPITDIITWAKISQYLGTFYGTQNRLLKGRDLDPTYPVLMRMERRALEFMYSFNPSDENLDNVANYVYSLIKYLAEAKYIAGQGGGGIIINPSTGARSTIQAISLEFELGVTTSPQDVNGVSVTIPNDGEDTIVLPLKNIIAGSLLLTIGGTPQPAIPTTNSTYVTISYSEGQAVIVLGPAGNTFINGNTYLISGLQLVDI